MSILFADGFELGTTLSEANTMSGNVITTSAFVNGTSTIAYGASSKGSGRSLTMAIFPTSTTSTNLPIINTPVTGFLGASGAIGYTFSFGFRARLNQNKTAISSNFGIINPSGVAPGTGPYVMLQSTTALNTLPQNIGIYFGGATVRGTIPVSDYNFHYYSFTATKTAANTWNVSVYFDSTQVYSATNLSAALTDIVSLYYCLASGTTITNQVNMFSEIDDVYVADQSPLGIINIRRISPTSDIQAQWTKVGSQPTNYQSVDNVSLTTGNSVTSTVAAQDIYGTGSTLTGGYKLLAVQATAMCVGAATDTVTANASAGANSIASSAVALSGLDTRVSTGWQNLVVAGSLNTLSFGQTKA